MTELAEVEEVEEEVTEDLAAEDQTDADELEEVIEEDWQKVEEDTQDPEYQVDGKLHQSMKEKLKGRVADRDETIERLRRERDEAKQRIAPEPTVLVRPKSEDFYTDEEYEAAKESYDDARQTEIWNRNQSQKEQQEAQKRARQALVETVDKHYERAAELTEKSGIKPEIFKEADATVRRAVDSVKPGMGDLVVDQVISIMGEGSEKVLYFLGRNKPALDRFQSLLATDPSGMKAAVYLGQEKQRLTNPTKPRSSAKPPAPSVQGDEVVTASASKLRKAYNKADKDGNAQARYDIKKKAKEQKIDVSEW